MRGGRQKGLVCAVLGLATMGGAGCMFTETPPRPVWAGAEPTTMPRETRHRAVLAVLAREGAKVIAPAIDVATERAAFFRHVRVSVARGQRYRVVALGERGATRISLWQHGAFLAEDASPGRDAYVAWDSFSDGTATVGIAGPGAVRLVFYAHPVGHLPLPLDRGEHPTALANHVAQADLHLRRLAFAPLLEPVVGREGVETTFPVEAGACYAIAARDEDGRTETLKLDLPGATRKQYLTQERRGGVQADFVCSAWDGRAHLHASSGDPMAVLVYRRHAPPLQCDGAPCAGSFELGDGFVMRTEGYELLFRGSLFRQEGKAFTLPAGGCAAFAPVGDDDPAYRLRVETADGPRRIRWERSYEEARWIPLCAGPQSMALRAYTVGVDLKEDFHPTEPATHDFAVVVPKTEPTEGFYLEPSPLRPRPPKVAPPTPPPPRGITLE